MIDQAILLLQTELQAYIQLTDNSVEVKIDNIALLETSRGDGLTDNIVITVVNVEEESTLKNQPALKRPFGSTGAIYMNPPTFLNLYLLFTCNYSGLSYLLALRRLSRVIQFLQHKNSFSTTSSTVIDALDTDNEDVLNLRFTLELYTLTFEQINHLWGSLGGRQVPFVMYKLRLVAVTERAVLREVPLIEEIETEHEPITT